MGLSTPIKTVWDVYGEPIMEYLGIFETPDRSYGRWQVPFSIMEKRLYERIDVDVTFHRVMLENGKDWVWYQVWQDLAAIKSTGRNADMIFVHGTGVHSGTLASQCRRYLDAGFRLLVPDLPSHGYSSGLHVYQSSLASYCAGLHAVLHDVARRDQLQSNFPHIRLRKSERKQTFMLGLSFGGLVAFSYALQYPASYRDEDSDSNEIPIDGIIGVGPMVKCNEAVSFNPIFRAVVLFFIFALGLWRMEFMVPHKKVVDKDPKVYKSLIEQDPRSHQGAFRLGHMYCIDSAMHRLRRRASEIKHPVYVQSGGQDRVADNDAALDWMRNLSSEDRRFEIYPICQHVIYKKGECEHDDLAGRVTVIADNVSWMCERSPVRTHRAVRQQSYNSVISDRSASLFDEEDLDHSDSDSTCTTATLQEDQAAAELDAVSTKFARADTSLLGWKLDDKGEKRLYRLAWDYKEKARPYLLYPYRT